MPSPPAAMLKLGGRQEWRRSTLPTTPVRHRGLGDYLRLYASLSAFAVDESRAAWPAWGAEMRTRPTHAASVGFCSSEGCALYLCCRSKACTWSIVHAQDMHMHTYTWHVHVHGHGHRGVLVRAVISDMADDTIHDSRGSVTTARVGLGPLWRAESCACLHSGLDVCVCSMCSQ